MRAVSIVTDRDGVMPQEIVSGKPALRADETTYWDGRAGKSTSSIMRNAESFHWMVGVGIAITRRFSSTFVKKLVLIVSSVK